MKQSGLSKFLAEFIGTFAMVFAGCGAIRVNESFGLEATAIPVAFGLAVAAMIYSVGHISGAHFNPAVTLAFALSRHFPKNQVLSYWAAQYGGGLLAISLLFVLLPGGENWGATLPAIEPWRAFLWEVILSFLLMFVIIAVATDTRAVGVMAGAAIGGTVMLCALFGGPVTGASMNPARSFAPNVFQGEWQILWLYTAAPILGAAVAAFTYEAIRCEEKPTTQQGCC